MKTCDGCGATDKTVQVETRTMALEWEKHGDYRGSVSRDYCFECCKKAWELASEAFEGYGWPDDVVKTPVAF